MTTLPVPFGPLAVESDIRSIDVGRRGAPATVIRKPFGRALQSDHVGAFVTNASGVPTDSAAVVFDGACASAKVRGAGACVGRLAAPTRG
ncbi:hypothetical protein AWB77_03208 [Caballeronia fortuita]|uniref:Uncharacterized protein n=1 Tax=Caballeronia fortuita TaxID=1777138 RepID=A0A158BSE7_9BURK|nr:hypothetical protein [Caballeronia fortuita]SAK72993.1 hypothetical protein AWB77_03208 [Caballeronia fortuita]